MRVIRMKHLPSRVRRFVHSQVHAHWRNQPIEPGTVLYESFSGNGMLCNPEAIFRELLATPDLAGLTHIWVLTDLRQYAATVREFAGARNVSGPPPSFGPVAVRVVGFQLMGALPSVVDRCEVSER